MSFTEFSSDFLKESFTLVDNLFINEHLPYCDETQIKVYLYGLYLCTLPQEKDGLERMCAFLGMDKNDVISTYSYFEDEGLVQIVSKEPFRIKYLGLKSSMQPPKKYKSEKWNDFNTHLQQLFPDRMLTPNEYNEYYSFLDSSKLSSDAMLMIVQYCINLKGENVRYPYILTVARNWAADGVTTVSDVEHKLNEYDAQSDQMRQVLQALGRKGGAELEEKQMLRKWTGSWGYELSAVLAAAKCLKSSKTFKKLDQKLDEFYRLSIFTAEEMQDYRQRRDKLTELAISINKNLGVFYESLEHVIEVYTIPWTTQGFSEEALKKIAHHCFIGNIRSLEGMNAIVEKFYAQGLLTAESIDEYLSAQIALDSKLKKIISASGRTRAVTASDREFYRTWTVTWGFGDDLILYAAELSAGKTYPVTSINQLLSDWKTRGIKSVDEAKTAPKSNTGASTAKRDYDERNYSDEELHSVITSIDKLKTIDL